MKRGLFLILFSFSSNAHAAFLESNVFYFTDTFAKDGTTSASTAMLLDFCFGFNIDKNGLFQAGWNYGMYSMTSSVSSATTAYKSTQMGPKFNYYLNKARSWGLSLSYNLSTSGSYSDGSGEALVWKGTGTKFDFGYIWRMENGGALGIRINYSTTTFIDQFTGGTDYKKITVARTHMYPGLYMAYEF